MEPRVAASVLAGALIRKAQGEGGFGAVLAKGDSTAGSILVILLEKGVNPRLSSVPAPTAACVAGERSQRIRIQANSKVHRTIERFDPDSWLIELDIPSAERFAAEMNAFD